MENQLTISNHSLSTPLQPKEIEIAKVVWHVNQILTYQLSDIQIESWARSINELKPDLDPNTLLKAINLVKVGKIEWDCKVGIPNIFWILNQVGNYIQSPETENYIESQCRKVAPAYQK